jgi:hypothetical protein
MSQAIQYRRLNVQLNLTSKDLGLAAAYSEIYE